MMLDLWSEPLSLSTYGFLIAALISLWLFDNRRYWGTLLALGVICGLSAGRLEIIALASIIALGAFFYVAQNTAYGNIPRIITGILGIALSVALGMHLIPGYANWKIAANLTLTANAQPYSIWLNFDKPLVGLFILAFSGELIRSKRDWLAMIKTTLPVLGVGLVVVLGLAMVLGYLQIDPKFTTVFYIWALRNLLFTCAAEEALFRGIIQKYLAAGLQTYTWGKWLALIIAAVLFGFAHIGGGLTYVLLASVAGLFYGYAYLRSGRIEAAILVHFLVNTTHFIFFTYPALTP